MIRYTLSLTSTTLISSSKQSLLEAFHRGGRVFLLGLFPLRLVSAHHYRRANCMLVAYCDEECQRAHREKHKEICKAKQVADARLAQFEE
jgi:hypothetical protein